MIWDFQKIGSGVVTDGFAMDTEIGLFAMKRDMVNRALQYFKDVKVEVHVVQMAPLGLCNFISYDLLKKGANPEETGEEEEKTEDEDQFKKRCIVALDIGTDNSNLVITDAERIIWQRPIPQGGNHFTRALTKELKLTFAKAEHIKRNATKSPDLKKILSALKPVLTDFVGEVQRLLGYFTNTHRDAQVAYMIGLGNAFRLPGLQKFLSEKLQLDVRKLQKLERMHGDTVIKAPAFSQNVLSFAVAYGLALQGLKLARLQTNLLPPDIQTERMVRAKKPWAVTAAAALLVGAAVMAVGFGLEYRALADPAIASAIDSGKQLENAIKAKISAADAKKADVDKNEEGVRSIMAGMDERVDWLRLNRFVDKCLPVPGIRIEGKLKGPVPGSPNQYVIVDKLGQEQVFPTDSGTLIDGNPLRAGQMTPGTPATVTYQPDQDALPYWQLPQPAEAKKVHDAFDRFWARLTGTSTDSKGDDEGTEYLIQVNLESVDARFCSDLGAFFTQLKAERPQEKTYLENLGMTKQDRDNPPQDKGWVVELRGFTYHYDQQTFLLRTLLQNLQIKGDAESIGQGEDNAVAPVTVPPAPGPGSSPPASPPSPGSPAKPDEPTQDKVDPVYKRVSHAILYKYQPDSNPDPFSFKIISSSVLPKLVVNTGMAAGAASGPGGGGSMGGGMVSSGSPSSVGGAAGSKDFQALLSGGTGNVSSSGSPSPSSSSMSSGPGGTRTTATTTAAGPTRTEFIMLFIWREPTPSDDRAAKAGGTAGGASLGSSGASSGSSR